MYIHMHLYIPIRSQCVKSCARKMVIWGPPFIFLKKHLCFQKDDFQEQHGSWNGLAAQSHSGGFLQWYQPALMGLASVHSYFSSWRNPLLHIGWSLTASFNFSFTQFLHFFIVLFFLSALKKYYLVFILPFTPWLAFLSGYTGSRIWPRKGHSLYSGSQYMVIQYIYKHILSLRKCPETSDFLESHFLKSHAGCFCFLPALNNAAMHICVQVFT